MAISSSTPIFLAGHRGFIGSAVFEHLKKNGFDKIITVPREDLDLCNCEETVSILKREQPEIVINAAGKSGGVTYNKEHPASLSLHNLMIQNSLFSAVLNVESVSRVIYFGSSCMYSRNSAFPMSENTLFKGELEETSFAYAMAKLSGISLTEAINKEFKRPRVTALIPSGVYGPGDDFNPNSSHVVAALIRKFVEAKKQNLDEVTLYGDGTPVRQFLYVKDLADFVLFCLKRNTEVPGVFNVGDLLSVTIKDLAEMILDLLNYNMRILWDKSKPNGAPYKVLDTTKSSLLGWSPETSLKNGLKETIDFFCGNYNY